MMSLLHRRSRSGGGCWRLDLTRVMYTRLPPVEVLPVECPFELVPGVCMQVLAFFPSRYTVRVKGLYYQVSRASGVAGMRTSPGAPGVHGPCPDMLTQYSGAATHYASGPGAPIW